jgi:hypothetical protein
MRQRHETRLIRLPRSVLSCLVASTFLTAPPAIAGPQTNVRWHPQEVFALTAGPGEVAYQQNENQDEDKEARIREGNRVRRGHLPSTDAAIPLWLTPLIVVSALGLITLGVALLVKVRNAEDEEYLLNAARVGGKKGSVAQSGASPTSNRARKASRTETNLHMIEGNLASEGEKGTSSDLRSVAKAWRVLGRSSIRRR